MCYKEGLSGIMCLYPAYSSMLLVDYQSWVLGAMPV